MTITWTGPITPTLPRFRRQGARAAVRPPTARDRAVLRRERPAQPVSAVAPSAVAVAPVRVTTTGVRTLGGITALPVPGWSPAA